MPEGDSLFIAARKLHEALAGHTIVRFATPRPELKECGVEGRRVVRARAHGKYAIIELDDGRAFLSHLRMQGRWIVSDQASISDKRRERLAREPRWDDEATTLVLETAHHVARLEHAAVIELAPLAKIERILAELGPDLLAPDYDQSEALAHLRNAPELTIAEALLRQSIVAGVGNVYKSEVLFLEKVNPFSAVRDLDDLTLVRLLTRSRDLLRRNLYRGRRRTTFGSYASSNYWVYERSGQHCMKCDAKIGMRRQGALQRSTYFCPECQQVPPLSG